MRRLGTPLKLRFSPRKMSATGVATGAILRAISKTNGPSRIPYQSIGIFCHIPCKSETEVYTADVLGQPTKCSSEEEDNIMNTLEWVKNVCQSTHVVFCFADLTKNGAMLDSVYMVTFLSGHVFQPTQTD